MHHVFGNVNLAHRFKWLAPIYPTSALLKDWMAVNFLPLGPRVSTKMICCNLFAD